MKKMNEKELEQFIHATLRSLPDRRAPGTLEARVLASLEHQATVAWYHKSWAHWPAAVRISFVALASALAMTVFVVLSPAAGGYGPTNLAHAAGSRFPEAAEWFAAGRWMIDLANRLVSNVPVIWLYGGLATLGAMYATFFGVGAAAYRAFRRHV